MHQHRTSEAIKSLDDEQRRPNKVHFNATRAPNVRTANIRPVARCWPVAQLHTCVRIFFTAAVTHFHIYIHINSISSAYNVNAV